MLRLDYGYVNAIYRPDVNVNRKYIALRPLVVSFAKQSTKE